MNAGSTTRDPFSATDFAAIGVNLVAYIKPVTVDGRAGFAVHAADGTPLTVVPGRDAAIAAVRCHEMELVSLH